MTEYAYPLRAGDLMVERYRLIDRIGVGGMAVIWRARDETLDRLVALKVLDPRLSGDERLRELARREAWAVARLNHPDVAGVHDFVRTSTPDGQEIAVIVLQLVAGEPLADRIALGALGWREAVRIGARIAAVLEVAHRRGVVHRDITPDNVMVHGEQVTVLDFGIAARIGEPDDDSTGASFGTPAYVAPERLDGMPAESATDVYALGVVLYEMLTGRPPFRVRGWDDVAADHGPVVPPDVPDLPRSVATLVTSALSREPAARPTAAEATRVLRAALARSPRRLLPLAAVAAGVAVLGVLAWTLPTRESPDDPGQAVGTPPASTPGFGTQSAATAPSGVATPTAASPAATGTRPAPSRSVPGATSGPSTVPVLTVKQAQDAALKTVDDAARDGKVRVDVATDLRNTVNNLVQARPKGAQLAAQAQAAHVKIDQRVGEGTLAYEVGEQLHADIAALARALEA
ncbi:serine/threonine-protein kinase [Catellatospora vulcania]|uniref:serine/threonine-protein kinase n=1 Tax=Catellatospora vulcania TaxID=1460450 RepID=UPI0012D4134A|nr:serine/threonine-protein kinase [Catellatospora vulcania]